MVAFTFLETIFGVIHKPCGNILPVLNISLQSSLSILPFNQS